MTLLLVRIIPVIDYCSLYFINLSKLDSISSTSTSHQVGLILPQIATKRPAVVDVTIAKVEVQRIAMLARARVAL